MALALVTIFFLRLVSGQFEDCWTQGACLESVLIDQIKSEDTLTCLEFCNGLENCAWFTQYRDKGLCTALSECAKLTQVPHTESGQKNCGPNPQCNIQGRCTGKLVQVSQTETFDSCGVICQSQE